MSDQSLLARELRKGVREEGVRIGSYLKIPSPDMVEVLGLAGVDFVVADAEHGPISPETCQEMTRAATVAGIPLLVRVGEIDSPATLNRFLDTGVAGLHFPRVDSREAAVGMFRSAAYPPIGIRGLAGARWAQYGRRERLPELAQEAWSSLFKVVQIEDEQALLALDELLAMDEPDVFFVGPTDLASSMGLHGDSSNQRVVEAVVETVRRITAAGRVAGTIATKPSEVGDGISLGARYIMLNAESVVHWGVSVARERLR